MSGANILQTPRKTYPSSDSGNSRLYGSVKDVTYCKNLLKNVNGELHTVAEAVYGRSFTYLYLRMKCRSCERQLNNFREFRAF